MGYILRNGGKRLVKSFLPEGAMINISIVRGKTAGYKVENPKIGKDDFGRGVVKVIVKSPVSGNNFSLNAINNKADSLSEAVKDFAEGVVDSFPDDVEIGFSHKVPEADDIVFSFTEAVAMASIYFYPDNSDDLEKLANFVAGLVK